MSARVTGEGLLSLALSLCNRRSLWQKCGPQILTSVIYTSSSDLQSPCVLNTKQRRSLLAGPPVHVVRYYSGGRISKVGLEEYLSMDQGSSSSTTDYQSTETLSKPTVKVRSFSDQLMECSSPTDVLDLYAQHSPPHQLISNCLTCMWDTTKKMSDDQRHYELQLMFEHSHFDKILQMAMSSAGLMRSADLAYSLLAVLKLGVPQNSRVVQTFLRACQEQLNEFDEKNMSVLATSLEHMDSSLHVNALKDGIRLVFEARLPRIKNVMALQTMMRLLGKDASLELKKKIEKKALSMSEQFTLPNCQYMISTMVTMNYCSKPLLNICIKKILENLHMIPFNRMLPVLKSCKELQYRDLTLFSAISDYIASTMDLWNKKQVILLLSVFEELAFCPTALMEAFAERLIASPDILTRRDLLSVLKTYSSLNCDLRHLRQKFLDSLTQVLESYLSKMSATQVLKAVYCLCLLGHFPSTPLEYLLQSNTLNELSSRDSKFLNSQERKFCTVDLCLRLDRPSLPQPLTIPQSVMGASRSPNVLVNPRFSPSLRDALGNGEGGSLQETVTVENFYVIDGVITKPLQPLAEGKCVKEVDSPTENIQRIAVICVPYSAFCYGTTQPCGQLAVKLRHLKILGYTPLVITEQELRSLSDEQKAEFLRARIFPENTDVDTEQTAE